jgi:hypothetical protein
VPQPDVDQSGAVAIERRLDAAAAVMADHHDVPTLSVDGELDHRQAVEIGVHDDVGDVAVDEQLARQQADDLVGRHARIRAADPQVLRRLQARQLEEVLGIDLLHATRPGAVEVEQVERGSRWRLLPPTSFQIEGEEHRAFERRLVVGWRFLETHSR